VFIHLSFEDGPSRDVPVSKQTTVKIQDGDLVDMVVLDGVSGLYLTTDAGGGAELGGVDPEEIATSIGWESPEAMLAVRTERDDALAALERSAESIRLLEARGGKSSRRS
jgi:hypothetical protein